MLVKEAWYSFRLIGHKSGFRQTVSNIISLESEDFRRLQRAPLEYSSVAAELEITAFRE